MMSIASFLSQLLQHNHSFNAFLDRESEGVLCRGVQQTSQICCVLAIADQCLSLFLSTHNVAVSENGLGE
jgi:hypothetical protein